MNRRLVRLMEGMKEVFGEEETMRLLASEVVVEDLREIAMTRTLSEIEEALAEARGGTRGGTRGGRVRRWGWLARRLLGPRRKKRS